MKGLHWYIFPLNLHALVTASTNNGQQRCYRGKPEVVYFGACFLYKKKKMSQHSNSITLSPHAQSPCARSLVDSLS